MTEPFASEGSILNIDKRKAEIDLRSNPENSNYESYKRYNARSKVWERFDLIKYQGVEQNLARCISCGEIFKYNPRTGTGSLLRHKCFRNKFDKNIDKPYNKADTSSTTPSTSVIKSLPENVKKTLMERQLNFVTADLTPSNLTEGPAFQEFAQELIKIGAMYGNVDVKAALCSTQTLTSTIMQQKYDSIKQHLISSLQRCYISFATDIWTDKYTQKMYLTLSAYFITEDFKLQKYTLGTRDLTELKSEETILETTNNILKEFNIAHKLEEGFIVTANSSNEISAFQLYKRISCMCHNLNLVMDDVFDINKCSIAELHNLTSECEKLVAFLKKSGLNSKLSKTIKQQQGDTRWNSAYIMLESVLDSFSEIINLLLEKNLLHLVTGINYPFLKEIIDFLKIFKECSEYLSYDSKPILHDVALWSQKLLNHCELIDTDSDVMRLVKHEVKRSIERNFLITDLHNVALFLNPMYKGLKILTHERKENIIQVVQQMLSNLSQDLSAPAFSDQSDQPPIKREKRDIEFSEINHIFKEFQDEEECDSKDNLKTSDPVEWEIETYTKQYFPDANSDILTFWKNNSSEFPLMAKLARRVLCTPASSSTSERVFSKSEQIFECKRTRIGPEYLDKIIFLHKNENLKFQ